jgi:ERCC4-type nuclease
MSTSDIMPEIYVDIHEQDSRIFDAISARNLGVVKGKHLETGDVLIRFKGLDVGIEIKRKADFDNSLKKGRLHDQIYRLTKSFKFPILIVERWHPYIGQDTGEDEVLRKMDIHKKQIRTLNRRICVIETNDQEDTVDEIERIVNSMKEGKLNVLRRKVILQDEQDPQVNLLAGLDNIGVARALDLLEMFGTPEKAFQNLDDWILVDGINKRRLKKIRNLWLEEVPR